MTLPKLFVFLQVSHKSLDTCKYQGVLLLYGLFVSFRQKYRSKVNIDVLRTSLMPRTGNIDMACKKSDSSLITHQSNKFKTFFPIKIANSFALVVDSNGLSTSIMLSVLVSSVSPIYDSYTGYSLYATPYNLLQCGQKVCSFS